MRENWVNLLMTTIADNPWKSLVSSIRRRRSPGARFFKPVCLIAAIDLANEGRLNPADLDAHAIALKFRDYVGLSYPERADEGWRPLWHLSNDGLWTFFSGTRALTREDFGPEGKPGSRAALFPKFDRLAINEFLAESWRSATQRQVLRADMISMLAMDDTTSRSFSRQLADPAAALQPAKWPVDPSPEVAAVEQLDFFHKGVGVEKDDASALDSGIIAEPFDPETIDVVTKNMTVDLLLSRARSKMIDLQPDFQRRWGIWDDRRKSRLIESLLLRIPLPVLYAAEDDDESWEIVDGIQRLSTIAQFIQPDIIARPPLLLSGLEYLDAYEGMAFGDLSDRLKMRLRETELVIHLIRKGTPPEVKFNVFARINTGGVPLSPQELRHAITPGPARQVLEDWARSPDFLIATDSSINPIRMDDRELVLRFLAFFVLGVSAYRQSEMDRFLIKAMKAVNALTAEELARAREAFQRAMQGAYSLFENDAFRKRVSPADGRFPINKALFEALSVNLATLDPESIQRLVDRREKLKVAFMTLCADREFESAISQGTGDPGKVQLRFARVAQLLRGELDVHA